MITTPTAQFAFLAAILGGLFFLERQGFMKTFFRYMPPVMWAYFVPMFATTFGILPAESEAYTWMKRYLLPFSLFLLMVTVDLKAILGLGRTALIMMLVGTAGIVIGGPVAYLIFKAALPPDAWMGMSALSGSWIGGTANLVAIAEHVAETQGVESIELGPAIIVDTVVGYGWMGVLLFLSAYKDRFNKWVKADTGLIESTKAKLEDLTSERGPITKSSLGIIIGLAFAAAALGLWTAGYLPDVKLPSFGGGEGVTVIGKTTWGILLVVTAGLLLSFTPMRNLEKEGATEIGYAALYLLLTAIGAQADLKAVLGAPMYLLAGIVWISVHIGLLVLAAKILRAPMFFVATGSMANIGGAASAPVVAGVYYEAMAPVGLLMAIAGYIVGVYAALGCATLLSLLA